MSLSIKNVVVDRIETATKDSPIAVFKTNKKGGDGNELFNAVFANTVKTQKDINKGCSTFMGVFYGSEGVVEFKRDIRGSTMAL